MSLLGTQGDEMRDMKYNDPSGKMSGKILMRPNLYKGESIIDLGVVRILKSRGFTIDEVAYKLGININTVIRWCR